MFGKVNCIYLQGMEGTRILVEADVSDGLPSCAFVGYLASEVKESQDRVRTAIKNLNLSLPPKKITINLSPADFRKEGTGFDLAIAMAILEAYGYLPSEPFENSVFIGELGLDGKIKGIPGVLAITAWAKNQGFSRIFLPEENVCEAESIGGIGLVGVSDLQTLTFMMRGRLPMKEKQRKSAGKSQPGFNQYDVDFSEVQGQPLLRRAAEVAVAGMHNLLMIGPAGSGKTMVARRMPTILPGMDLEECIEISKIYSVCHLLNEKQPLVLKRPFRAPHHTITAQALAGGGSRPRPGEISLATGGILFLDELPEMGRAAMEILRQPLEERCITISRVYGSFCYPANFQLVAAMNPCKCGYYPDPAKCTCTQGEIKKYLGRISRPLLERIDICVEAAPVTYKEMSDSGKNEDSAAIRARVEAAREIQKERFLGTPIRCNGEMNRKQIRKYCQLGKEESHFMEEIFSDLELSARMHDKILRVARTAADLEGKEQISHVHLCEAVSFARFREKYWKNW